MSLQMNDRCVFCVRTKKPPDTARAIVSGGLGALWRRMLGEGVRLMSLPGTQGGEEGRTERRLEGRVRRLEPGIRRAILLTILTLVGLVMGLLSGWLGLPEVV